MNLLITTQKVDINDPILGFFHGWIKEFARQSKQVTVICLYEGKHNLPKNVKVLSLGKEEGVSRLKYIYRLYKYSWQERKNYCNVLVHMNPEYVPLGFLLWKMLGKRIGLWYAHRSVNLRLRLATFFTDYIFTATKDSFRLTSKKINITGHGIDENKFISKKQIRNDKLLKLVSVGRISKIKDYETAIMAVKKVSKNYNVEFTIIGDTIGEEDGKYKNQLEFLVKENNLISNIIFHVPVENNKLIKLLDESNLFVHTSLTGSLDKVAIESIFAELLVVSCNDSSFELLKPYQDKLMFEAGNHNMLAEKIEVLHNLSEEERVKMKNELRQNAVSRHSLKDLISKIIKIYK